MTLACTCPVSIQAGARGLFRAAPVLRTSGLQFRLRRENACSKMDIRRRYSIHLRGLSFPTRSMHGTLALSRCGFVASDRRDRALPSLALEACYCRDHAGPFWWRRSIAGGKSRWATRRLIRGLEEREVLQEAELSRQADSENNLGGCSETMYYICPPTSSSCRELPFLDHTLGTTGTISVRQECKASWTPDLGAT